MCLSQASVSLNVSNSSLFITLTMPGYLIVRPRTSSLARYASFTAMDSEADRLPKKVCPLQAELMCPNFYCHFIATSAVDSGFFCAFAAVRQLGGSERKLREMSEFL